VAVQALWALAQATSGGHLVLHNDLVGKQQDICIRIISVCSCSSSSCCMPDSRLKTSLGRVPAAVQTDDPRKSSLVRCCRSDVQQLLGISRGGEAALQCVAQLAGGDYDTTGAEQVWCENSKKCCMECCVGKADSRGRTG
jgi:hypothetical protein